MSSTAVHGVTFAAVIVAAGSGTRFGRSKHDLVLRGTPLWQRCVDTFTEAGIDEIIVVGDVPGGIPGGTRRRDSVLLGLEAIPVAPDWVLIHDAARPLVSTNLIHSVIDASIESGADGVIPVVPVTDTVKRIEGHHVVATVERVGLVVVQTPQAFRFETLVAVHRTATGADATDDAALVELEGGSVVVVEGERSNMKITYRGDLAVAESILDRSTR